MLIAYSNTSQNCKGQTQGNGPPRQPASTAYADIMYSYNIYLDII